MARIETDPNYSSPTFSRATAGTDLFKKEDVQALAAAVSTHDHSAGKGAVLTPGAIPAGSITSAMIADGTIVAGDIADGAVTSAKILDGTIATVDLANGAVTNAKLAADTARDNLLTNGGFEIWQRGAGPFSASVFTTDRWAINSSAGATWSVVRDTANVDAASLACAACTISAFSSEVHLSQRQEDVTQLRGRVVSFSVRVRTATANAVRASIGQDSGLTYGTYHSGSGTYQTLTVTATVAANATIVSPNITFNANCTAYVDNAMLVVGSVAADYAPLHPADDLARCLRYYEKIGPSLNYPQVSSYGAAAGAGFFPLPWATKKAVTPTITVGGTFAYVNASGVNVSGPTVDGVVFGAQATATGSFIVYSNNSGYFVGESNP